MGRLKNGTWVRLTADNDMWGRAGDVGQVVRQEESGAHVDFVKPVHGGGIWRVPPAKLEAWVPKVGERVRYSGKSPAYSEQELVGLEGTVTHVGSYQVSVKWDRDVVRGIPTGGAKHLAYVEPLPLAPQPAAQERAALKIEAGRYYKTRDGRKVGPMSYGSWGGFFDTVRRVTSQRWEEDGSFIKGQISNLDLIAEWQEPATNVGAQVDTLAEEYGSAVATASNDNAPERKLVKTGQGYGYELARFGDYVWVDTGKTAPITLRADKIAA